jgi:hypothetical protein
MKLPEEMPRRHAWWGTVLASVLSTLGLAVEIAVGRGGLPHWQGLLVGASTLGAVMTGILVGRRKLTTVVTASVFFALDVSIVLAVIWIVNPAAQGGRSWSLLQADRLAVLGVAMLAPSVWVGISSILGFIGVAVGRYLLAAAATRGGLLTGEPGIMLLYGVFGAALLVYRVRRLAIEREILQVHAEAALAERLAQAFLAVRDFANTPIQTIAISVAVLRARCPELAPTLDRIARSVVRLTELGQLLRAYESHLTWLPGDVSFDPSTRIKPPPAPRRTVNGRRAEQVRTPPASWRGGAVRTPVPRR